MIPIETNPIEFEEPLSAWYESNRRHDNTIKKRVRFLLSSLAIVFATVVLFCWIAK
jgi:hypothetical protein